MRRVLRRTAREGFERIAVVCGAWHVPALRQMPSAASDDRLLRGLPKVKAAMTWVPWTYGRLSYASGYGAGIRSPGWYDHLFSSPGQPIERWLARAAAVLRADGIPASSAHVIESVRLAAALAALRGRPLAGLEEVTEAAHAVLCEGSDLLVALIQRRAGGRRAARHGAARHPHGAAPARPAGSAAPPEAAARGGAPGLRPGPAQAERPGPQPPALPARPARRAVGHDAAGPDQEHRDVPGELAADLAARARPGADRGEHVGQHGRGGRHPAGPVDRGRRGRPRRPDRADRAVPARRPRRRPGRGARGGQGPRRARHRRDPPDGGAAGAGPRGQVRRRARHRPGPAGRGRHRDDHQDLRGPAGRGDVPGRDGRTGHAGAHRRGARGHRAARRQRRAGSAGWTRWAVWSRAVPR